MKKALSLFLVTALILTCFSLHSFALDNPEYVLESKSIQAGEAFSLEVGIKNNPGIVSLRFKVEYDSSALELVGASDTGLLNGYTAPSSVISSPYTLRWADSLAYNNNSENGTVATLNFVAKSTASSGAYYVVITPVEARDFNGEKISFASITAAVVIEDVLAKGDVNADGQVSLEDYALIKAYLQGEELSSQQLKSADLDGDGAVDAFDLFYLNKAVNMENAHDFEYTAVSGNDIKITGYTGTATQLQIPSVIDGHNVVALSDYAFKNNTTLKSVKCSTGLTRVNYGAFLNCTSLEEVELSGTVKTIGTYAFKGCTNLKKIVIPASVTSINANSFTGCTMLSIYGEEGSFAQTYAEANGINFVVIG